MGVRERGPIGSGVCPGLSVDRHMENAEGQVAPPIQFHMAHSRCGETFVSLVFVRKCPKKESARCFFGRCSQNASAETLSGKARNLVSDAKHVFTLNKGAGRPLPAHTNVRELCPVSSSLVSGIEDFLRAVSCSVLMCRTQGKASPNGQIM